MVVTTSLLKDFQKRTVDWMLNRESSGGGGFLFNEAGTGKTICCIDTVLRSYRDGDITLIVCPAGLVYNWEREILMHTDCHASNVFKYIGSGRMDLVRTSGHIFCIASYSVLSRELLDSGEFVEGSLFRERFTRVILDEAHYIRNPRSAMFKAAMNLGCNLNWVVTATPIFNKMDDMYAYFRFLGLGGVDTRRDWRKMIHSASGLDTYRRLNTIISENAIRMRKVDVLSELGQKNEHLVEINLTDFEKEFYGTLWDYSVGRMRMLSQRLRSLGGFGDNSTLRKLVTNNILVYILRLKQSCNNPWLVISKMRRLGGVKSLRRATERLQFYNSSLNMEEECPICYDNIADGIASPCGHKCCMGCWGKIMRLGMARCPSCRVEVDSVDRVNHVTANEPEDLDEELKCSSKIVRLLQTIRECRSRSEKVVVVSQWVKMLDIVKDLVSREFSGIRSVTLQGSMTMNLRENAIRDFGSDTGIEICYISLMSSAEGINLTSANNLVLLDTWWNQSKMIQVCDRIHRIGQTKPVNIYRFVVNTDDSIEQRITRLVSKKERLKNLVMNKWELGDGKGYDDEWIRAPVKLIG